MKALVKELLHLTEVRQLTEDVRGGVSPVLVTGVGPVHRAQVEAALHRDSGRPLWVLCADEREARRQAGDRAVLTGETPLVLPARELQWRPMESSRQWENQRLAALYRLADSPVVVTTPDALVQRCIPPRVLERPALTLAVGQQWDLNALARRLAGRDGEREQDIRDRGLYLLDQMGLSDRAGHYPHQLSGGQKQRVAIARALCMEPDVLCFDEPTSALDPELTGEVLRVIRQLAGRRTTMIVVTHEMAFARDVADRLIFMDGGVIVEQGDPRQVMDHPRMERIRQFLSRCANT